MRKASSLWFILVTVAIDSIGLGIVIPVLPDVIRRFLTDEFHVSRMFGYFVATYAFVQFFSSPFLGSLSDWFGRRTVLLVSLLGAAVDYFFMAFAPTLPLLFLGRVISGMSGASYTVASAYIADISTDENRSKNFGVIGAGFGIGFIAGPAIGGFLAHWGPQYPFLAAGCFNLLNFVFGFFVLPESLSAENRRPVQWAALNPFRAMGRILSIPTIRPLVVVSTLMYLAGHTHPSIWTLYTEHRFGWTPAQVGMSLALVGLLQVFAQGFLTGFIVKRFGETRVFVWGVFGESLSFLGFGLATSGSMIYAVLLLSAVFWAAQPALQSLISREVPADQQGELQGTLMSLASVMAIINPLIVTSLFAATSDRTAEFYLPGSPYIFASSMLFLAWVIAWRTVSKTLAVSNQAPL